MSRPYFIGIAGGSASGKTTVLNDLLNTYSKDQVVLISQDNYYKSRAEQQIDEQGIANFDLPSAIETDLFERDLSELKAGRAISKLEYTFNNPNKEPQSIEVRPAEVIIVEGLFVFHFDRIDQFFDSRIYVDSPPELRLQRRIARDFTERGYPEDDVRYRWKNHVRPADILYLEPHKSRCELVIENNSNTPLDLSPLHHLIQNYLQREVI